LGKGWAGTCRWGGVGPVLRRHLRVRIGGDVGQGARPGQAEQGAMGIIQSRTRQIRCYWYRRIIEGGMTKS
jgi:hypothetical protein